MKIYYALMLSILFLISSKINAQVSDINFVNTNYKHGIQPNNIGLNDIYEVYTSWRTNFVTSCNNGRYRINFDAPNENQTVSEGIAYGMLLSVFANDKELFDGLWLFYQDHSNNNGVMHWRINGCDEVIGQNGATDAELDAAYALIVADKRWGNTGTVNYKNAATSLISIIKSHEVEASTHVLKPGDAWGGASVTNPSYFTPGYFRVFGTYTNDETFWNTVVSKSYTILNANLSQNNAVYNLVSDWCNAEGNYASDASGYYNQGKSYYYDAARTPWRIATDYIWYEDASALNYTNLCIDFVNAEGGFDKIYPGYSQAGVAINTTYKDATFTGAYANAAMSSSNQNFVNDGYDELKSQTTDAYFGATLRVIYMYFMSGNFYNALSQNILNVEDLTKKSFNVYPNPVKDIIHIKSNTLKLNNIKLYDFTGKIVLSKDVNHLNYDLNLSDLNTGIYFLQIEGENLKLVKH